MATAAKLAYGHITKDPMVCGGKACIDHSRIRVMDIVELEREGRKPEEMLNLFGVPLTLAQVYSAFAYASDDTDEIAADFAAGARVEAEIERDRTEHLSRRHSR